MTIAEQIDKAWDAGDDEEAIALSDRMATYHTVAIHDLDYLWDADAPGIGLSQMTEYDDGSFAITGDACLDESGNEVSGPLTHEQGLRLLALNDKAVN